MKDSTSYDRKGAVAYLYATFRDNSVEGEQMYYSVSTDGYHYTPLNNGCAVFASSIGDCSIRDPYIFEGQNGWFYMISSDVRSSDDWNGHSMVSFRSRDLIHWTDGKRIDFHDYESTKNDTKDWAPEAVWDPKKGMYMLYWASEAPDRVQSIWYAYTEDFSCLITQPAPLYAEKDGLQIIDPHICYYEGVYHLYFTNKYNNCGLVHMATAKYLTGPYGNQTEGLNLEKVPSEGPNLVKLIGQKKWLMLSDGYCDGYVLLRESTDLIHFRTLTPEEYAFGGPARSGSIFQITQAEYDALLAAFPADAAY